MFQFGSRQRAKNESSVQERYSATSRNGATTVAYSPRDLGALLRERREAMGVSLVEAEAATRIRQKYIAALEADEWHLLPGEVVGRGFLRNYSTFLGLEPNDVLSRRRSTADDSLASILSTTSAGNELPPIRQVDYRPKDVDLREENEVMETRELRLAPVLTIIAAALLLALFWFGREPIAGLTATVTTGVQTMLARSPDIVTPPVTEPSSATAIVNPENTGGGGVDVNGPTADDTVVDPAPAADGAEPSLPAAMSDDGAANSTQPQPPANAAAVAILIPTATPTPGAPAEELPPLPTPTPFVVEAPAEVVAADTLVEPAAVDPAVEGQDLEIVEPEEIVVVPAACPDPRALIASPGVNEPVAGVIPVNGTASHEAFQYYKLEYAPGAGAAGGFVYFDGGNQAVVNGQLGSFNTTALPNGPFTLQIVVVDQTGNFPPPCRVTVDIQN